MRSVAIHSIAGVLIATSALAEDQIISIPGEDWKIHFDAPRLTPDKGIPTSVFYGRAVFVSDPRRYQDAIRDREFREDRARVA
jgi:hypothetical protein